MALLSVPLEEGDGLDAERFFGQYVAPRKPVLIRGHFADDEWQVTARWSLAWFEARAGPARVKAEVRDPDAPRQFGRGREASIRVSALCKHVAEGGESLYMTTQDLEHDEDGRPTLFGSPLTRLADSFSLRPRLAGNLIPANINLWLGRSSDGSSSGLHHDFHDNLYVLLRGRKRFRLISPADALRLPMVGRIVSVHHNGRIEYEGEPVNADGSATGAADAVAAAERQETAAADLAAAEEALGRGEPGAAMRVKAAEEALEAALDEVLLAEAGGAMSSEGDDDGEDDGEDEARMAAMWDAGAGPSSWPAAPARPGSPNGSGDVSDSSDALLPSKWLDEQAEAAARRAALGIRDDDDDDNEDGSGPARPRLDTSSASARRQAASASARFPAQPFGITAVLGPADARAGTRGRSSPPAAASGSSPMSADWAASDAVPPPKPAPKNFCTVTGSQVAAEGTVPSLEVEVCAGDTLFVPAGWFHEVISESAPLDDAGGSSPAATSPVGGTDVLSGGVTRRLLSLASSAGDMGATYHAAFNYWFHPPDSADFSSPYESAFWANDWTERGFEDL